MQAPSIRHKLSAHWPHYEETHKENMDAGMSRFPKAQDDDGTGPQSGAGYIGHLRDADWAPRFSLCGSDAKAARTEVLYRWRLPLGDSAGALTFQPLDGNPRHGVLALYVSGRLELHGAIEILERQGCWLVMPNSARAAMLAASAPISRGAMWVPRSSMAGTPDRRFVFFNTVLEGGTVTLVERRRNGEITDACKERMAPL
jgi:hypothetical protein